MTHLDMVKRDDRYKGTPGNKSKSLKKRGKVISMSAAKKEIIRRPTPVPQSSGEFTNLLVHFEKVMARRIEDLLPMLEAMMDNKIQTALENFGAEIREGEVEAKDLAERAAEELAKGLAPFVKEEKKVKEEGPRRITDDEIKVGAIVLGKITKKEWIELIVLKKTFNPNVGKYVYLVKNKVTGREYKTPMYATEFRAPMAVVTT